MDRKREIQALGEWIRQFITGSFSPHFVVEEDGIPESRSEIDLCGRTTSGHQTGFGGSIIATMCETGVFRPNPFDVYATHELSPIRISLHLRAEPYASSATGVPISGFPRFLMNEEKNSGRSPCPVFYNRCSLQAMRI